MLRFYHTEFENNKDIVISNRSLFMNNSMWHECRSILQEFVWQQDDIINVIPIKNASGELIAYGYQDSEANRELRMLRELREDKHALQFTDIFTEYKEVLIWGCNELAVHFAEYLKQLGITVAVTGQYWDMFGYDICDQNILLGRGNKLIIYAEEIPLQNHSLHETVIRSVSPEFECIDKIYEANVLDGRIRDTIGDFGDLICRLKDESEIVILGEDREAQDTYDLLMAQGIDICCFAVPKKNIRSKNIFTLEIDAYCFAMPEKSDRMLLGKRIMGVEDAIRCLERPVFLNYRDVNGALGEEWTEYFDYRGYERNKQYFLVRDYTEIPTSNLVHILFRKNVLLTGDFRLCQLLSDYLNAIENGEVNVIYIPLGERVSVEEEDILCLVIPDYCVYDADTWKERRNVLEKNFSEMKYVNFTTYFCCSRAFVLIDLYLNRNYEKYTVPELSPKGILLGCIPTCSGNYLMRGIVDGHPEILLIPTYTEFNDSLFWYCVRLANVESDKVISIFGEIYSDKRYLLAQFWERFKSLLGLKDSFTSQELFVLFHIAYAEMLTKKQISDITSLVIYWEPHHVSRDEFPYFALWLEDAKLRGQTMILRRNHITKMGSWLKIYPEERTTLNFYKSIFWDMSDEGVSHLKYSHWTEFKMRFEDIKVRPKEKLMEICRRLEIAWSDNMLHTTEAGEMYIAEGRSMDFELKPVFNKYEDYFSSFDRFRISIAGSYYQRRYGYSYDNCLRFSRRELRDMFLKPFLFENILDGKMRQDYSDICEWVGWQLWNVRKHMVLDDVCPEFDRFELEQIGEKRVKDYNQKEIDKSVEYIINHDKLILYGIGNDCQGLLRLVDENVKERLLYSDKKAADKPYIFKGKNVIVPKDLCSIYKDYNILVTSSWYRLDIEYELESMGINPSRVYYNRGEFEENKK